MTARQEGGQAGLRAVVERLYGYGLAAAQEDKLALAHEYFTRALQLIDEAGLAPDLRMKVLAALRRAEHALRQRPLSERPWL